MPRVGQSDQRQTGEPASTHQQPAPPTDRRELWAAGAHRAQTSPGVGLGLAAGSVLSYPRCPVVLRTQLRVVLHEGVDKLLVFGV